MSDTYAVIYAPEALDDLRNIYAYIAVSLKAPGTARKQVNRIREEVRSLDCMPRRYTHMEHEPWRSMGMHRMPVDNFVVYYLVDVVNSSVTIVRIFYGGRDVESVLHTGME